MEKILISACLIGDKCRYDGKSNYNPKIRDLLERYELIPFCPECEGGLKTPRIPAERKGDRVINQEGRDVTHQYEKGAELAFNICLALKVKVAILKENSPSCGTHKIHDGTFCGKLIDGMGTTAEYLARKGIKVISENEIDELLK
ncbi:MAG: DUF523 domain-containing protein [Bacilli bacterium]|nr:DUF523 domain-containing protein [Bacilli bacterium]